MKGHVVETNQLVKQFGSFTAVNEVNIQVPKGGIYGFLGPNGAGKSTTIRMLLGLVYPTSGYVNIFGQDIQRERFSILQRVGSMVESPAYYGHLSAQENLEVTRKIRQVARQEIDRVLEIVGLTTVRGKSVKKFSLGMKQRLGIAQALLGQPELLILDEPTNGLDPEGILEIRSLIQSLPEQYGITVLISSHILSEIEQVATHVGIIHHGNLLFQGALSELKNKQEEMIQLQVTEQKRAQQFLVTQGYAAATENDYILIAKNVAISPAELNRKLVMEGFEVNELVIRRYTLEDIFLQMTRQVSS